MNNRKIYVRFGAVALIILLAALSRLIPHPANFAPIGAMALFGAAYYKQKYLAFTIPVVTMWMSDLIINNTLYSVSFTHFTWFYPGCYWTYGSFILIGLIGMALLRKVNVLNLIASSILASLVFYLVSNFGVWTSGLMYPKDFNGLATCYVAGLPFLKNTLLGDLVYSGVLFGAYELAIRRFPVLQSRTV
jgi:hypothetical protein